jgi:hypothetical protein
MYLSSIQQGIQNAHVVADMFIKYDTDGDAQQERKLYDWAENHKTMILLNGGYSETIRNLLTFFCDKQNPYPYKSFCEGQDALDGALTCVGIILPEKIYVAASLARKDPDVLMTINNTGQLYVDGTDNESGERVTWTYNSWEAKLIAELNKYGLAS